MLLSLCAFNAPSAASSGDVVGPSSAADNAIARFDTTTGKAIQNSGATISDDGKLGLPAAAAGYASLNIPHGTVPASPANGDVWSTTGWNSYALGGYSVIGGGNGNQTGAGGQYQTVGGGTANNAGASYSTVGGGQTNVTNSGTHATVSGGNNNQALGQYGTVGGGNGNAAGASLCFIGGGAFNTASVASHAAVTGGLSNSASGQYAFIGGGNNNTASGERSVIPGGRNNTASGQYSFAGGYLSQATGTGSFAFGQSALANAADAVAIGNRAQARGVVGAIKFANGSIGSDGDSQMGIFLMRASTTNSDVKVMTTTGAAAAATNIPVLANNQVVRFRGEIIARRSTAASDIKIFTISGTIKRGADASTTAIVGTPVITAGDADSGTEAWAVTVTADTTLGGLSINVLGDTASAFTVRWYGRIDTIEN